jgi:prolyl-tRNA synthetase
MQLAVKIYSELQAKGVDVILDDRDERPGVKFKDSELVGFPIRVGIGEKSLAKGEVEIKRRGGSLEPTPADKAVERVLAVMRG